MAKRPLFIDPRIAELVEEAGGDPQGFEGTLVCEMIQTSLKLIAEEHTTAQLKLINRSLKEMRYAYRIFNRYLGGKCLSMFGSARTRPDHPDYLSARELSRRMEARGWMCITGAAEGIMRAGLEGATADSSFGLAIRLAFEDQPSSVIQGDPKLISFRYFFIRKLMFMAHSDAAVALPGGFGTQDELFEILTLMQTGKSVIMPVILLEGEGGRYWKHWESYVKRNLLKEGKISPEDRSLYYIAPGVEQAVEHIERFYRRYHSSRFVKELFVIRLKEPLGASALKTLNRRFSRIVASGTIEQRGPLPEEADHLELERLAFEFTKRDFGLLRQMIDWINSH